MSTRNGGYLSAVTNRNFTPKRSAARRRRVGGEASCTANIDNAQRPIGGSSFTRRAAGLRQARPTRTSPPARAVAGSTDQSVSSVSNHWAKGGSKPRLLAVSNGWGSWRPIVSRSIALRVNPGILTARSRSAMSSTRRGSRKGTRASSECAMELRSTLQR